MTEDSWIEAGFMAHMLDEPSETHEKMLTITPWTLDEGEVLDMDMLNRILTGLYKEYQCRFALVGIDDKWIDGLIPAPNRDDEQPFALTWDDQEMGATFGEQDTDLLVCYRKLL